MTKPLLLYRTNINHVSVLDMSGDIEMGQACRIRDIAQSLIEREQCRLVLNLSSVWAIGYFAGGVLLGAANILREHDGDLKLCGVCPTVRRTLVFGGLYDEFEKYLSLEDAIASFDDEWEGAVEC